MNPNDLECFSKVIESLRELDSRSVSNDVSSQYLEIKLVENQKEFRISGNSAGLIYLSRVILELAFKDEVGSHFHIDETGVADICDIPLVVCLKQAVWENPNLDLSADSCQ